MFTDPDTQQRALDKLANEAERLQTQVNEFIGRATMARLDLPAALYEANAELLLVPGRLRALAERPTEDRPFRRGMAEPATAPASSAQAPDGVQAFRDLAAGRERSSVGAGVRRPGLDGRAGSSPPRPPTIDAATRIRRTRRGPQELDRATAA
jgi:hypothetical protein